MHFWNPTFVSCRKELWAIEHAGQLVGSAGGMLAEATPDVWLIAMVVRPALRRRGIGTYVYNQLVGALHARGARRLLVGAFAHQHAGRRFLAHRGFRATGGTFHYRLRTAEADLHAWGDPDALVAAHGLRFTTLDRLPRKGLAARLLPVWNRTRPDQPQHWPYLPYHVQRFEREMLEPPEVALHHSIAILAADGRMAAFTLQAYVSDTTLYSMYLGVDPDFRGRGLASTLKLKLVAHAQARGVAFLAAENDARNMAMRHINQRLGFRQESERVVYEVMLADAPT